MKIKNMNQRTFLEIRCNTERLYIISSSGVLDVICQTVAHCCCLSCSWEEEKKIKTPINILLARSLRSSYTACTTCKLSLLLRYTGVFSSPIDV